MTRPDGGPAFPVPGTNYHVGMSVRTWLVGIAMQGMLANPILGKEDAEIIARWACEHATAVLAELEKPPVT